MFLSQWVLTLLRQPAAPVVPAMVEPWPDCDTIFLRKSNQVYCSRRCVNRVTQRHWRERQAVVVTAATPEAALQPA